MQADHAGETMTGSTWQLGTTLSLASQYLRTNAAATLPLSTTQTRTQSLSFGTGEGLHSIACAITQGLQPGASVTFDLYDGSTPDVYGDGANFRVLRAFALWVSAGGDEDGLSVSGGASNPHTLWFTGTTPGQTVYPNGPPAMGGDDVGKAVTSTARTIKITNNAAVATSFVLLLAGTSGAPGVPLGMLLGLTYP